MKRPLTLAAALGAAFVAAAVLSPAAAHAGNVAWSVAIGGPGFAVSAGQPGFVGAPWAGAPFRPHWRPAFRPVVVAPPVVVSPWYAPIALPVPAPVFVPRPVVVRPAPVLVAPRRVVVVPAPRYGGF